MKMLIIEPIRDCLARTPDPDDHWLWCIECKRFFHFTRLIDRDTHWPRCPFFDCHGYGWDFSIFFWDQHREPEDERWPASASELRHGMHSPEMDSWYEARRMARIEALVSAFESSVEAGREPSRHLRAFLKMSGDLCWDLSDPDDQAGFDDELVLLLLGDLPVWAQCAELTEADRMLAELRAFFLFAERTGAVEDADQWSRVLGDDGIADRFRDTMRTDRRLRPRTATRARRARRGKVRRRERRR